MRVLAAEEQLHLGAVPAHLGEVPDELPFDGQKRLLVQVAQRVADVPRRQIVLDQSSERVSLPGPISGISIRLDRRRRRPPVDERQIHRRGWYAPTSVV